MTPTQSLLTTVLEKTGQMTVANLGTSGYGPQQELAVLKRYALPLHPKTIVWVFYEGNDLRDVHVYEQDKRAVTRQSFEGKLDRSFTKNVLEGVLRITRGCVPDPYLERNYGTMVDKNGDRSRIYFVDAGMPLSDDDIEALKKTQAALAEAYRLSRERGIRFVVVFAPTTFRVHHGLSNLVEVSANVKKWVVNDLPDRLRAIVNGISPEIDYVDLTPILKAEVERGNQVFLSDDTHWTTEGHRIVAQTIQSFALDGSTQFAKRRDQLPKANSFVDWTHKALMVRATDGTIKYWNKGAEQLYGWKPKDTVGKTSHRLLKTVFPKPLPSIEAELSRTGRWEGELVHKRRDGSQVVVASRWELQRNGSGQIPLVIEINSERSPGSDPGAPQKFNN
jgi:PAS domain S-box-containing protein